MSDTEKPPETLAAIIAEMRGPHDQSEPIYSEHLVELANRLDAARDLLVREKIAVVCNSLADALRAKDSEIARLKRVAEAVGTLNLNDMFVHSGGEPLGELFFAYADYLAAKP